jgi:AAA15 family ATPase/GTPase
MTITLKSTYKSLDPFTCTNLPKFSVITGRNGSGKSQLIELVEAFRDNKNPDIIIDVDRLKIQVGGLTQPTSASLDSSSWTTRINEYWMDYVAKHHLMKVIEKLIASVPTIDLSKVPHHELQQSILKDALSETKAALDKVGTFRGPIARPISDDQYCEVAASQILEKRGSFHVAQMVATKARKGIQEIDQSDFMRFPPDEGFLDRRHLFYSSIEQIFYAYAKRRHQNLFHSFANKELDKKYDSLTDAEFISRFPPPWQTINLILTNHALNYSFQEIAPDSFVNNVPIDFKLIKNSNKKRIDFASLSSGEKVIIALVVKLFTTEFYSKTLELPELIVLDEPDAHLHPELGKLLIDVLSQSFVGELGLTVMITTHSPSTVALAPEESLYELKNEPLTSLTKITKDNALGILTKGVPTLSIDYKNHRQVFVESPTDVVYYQSLHDVLSQNEKLTFKPYFISYSKGKGNCDQVIDIVNKLKVAGNDKVFGIVDWDGKRSNVGTIFVHGKDCRYSVENFIYDPPYIVELFLDLKGAENVVKELGFALGYKHYDMGLIEPNSQLQKIADWVIGKVSAKYKGASSLASSSMEVKYYNNKTLRLPNWYLQMNGHELETKLKETFPSLAGKFRSEGDLQRELTSIISKSFPFWPVDTVMLLKGLCE